MHCCFASYFYLSPFICDTPHRYSTDLLAGLFLATGDIEFQQRLREEYGSKVVTFSKLAPKAHQSTDRRQSSLAHAAIDVYLLAKCKHLFTTAGSSFSRWALILWQRAHHTAGETGGTNSAHIDIANVTAKCKEAGQMCGSFYQSDDMRCPKHSLLTGYNIPGWGRDCRCAWEVKGGAPAWKKEGRRYCEGGC
jgi:hypothetical protein